MSLLSLIIDNDDDDDDDDGGVDVAYARSMNCGDAKSGTGSAAEVLNMAADNHLGREREREKKKKKWHKTREI